MWERKFQGPTASLFTSVGKLPSLEQISRHLLLGSQFFLLIGATREQAGTVSTSWG